jgi:hypothetical protein
MKSSTPNKAPDLVEQLFKAAFDTARDPRSAEYKEGVRAALNYRVNGKHIHHPYPATSAQSDAFHAGTAEGHAIWRAHQEKQGKD